MNALDSKMKVLATVFDHNGGLDVREVGGLWSAVGMLFSGELKGRPAYHFYRRRSFPFFGGWVRPKVWLSVTYKGMQTLRANGYRAQDDSE
jgi:hypothetical protein